jgi:hypothetical protein
VRRQEAVRIEVSIGEEGPAIDHDQWENLGEPSANLVLNRSQAFIVGVPSHP